MYLILFINGCLLSTSIKKRKIYVRIEFSFNISVHFNVNLKFTLNTPNANQTVDESGFVNNHS